MRTVEWFHSMFFCVYEDTHYEYVFEGCEEVMRCQCCRSFSHRLSYMVSMDSSSEKNGFSTSCVQSEVFNHVCINWWCCCTRSYAHFPRLLHNRSMLCYRYFSGLRARSLVCWRSIKTMCCEQKISIEKKRHWRTWRRRLNSAILMSFILLCKNLAQKMESTLASEWYPESNINTKKPHVHTITLILKNLVYFVLLISLSDFSHSFQADGPPW